MNDPPNHMNPDHSDQPGPERNTPMDPTPNHAGRPAGQPDDERADLAADPRLEERIAAQVTAYALGELPEDEARAVELLLTDPARAAERDSLPELRSVATALRQAVNADRDPPSADLRRAVVATLAAGPPVTPAGRVPSHATSRGRNPFRWLSLAGGLAAAASVAVMVTSSWRTTAPQLGMQGGGVSHDAAVTDAPITDLAVAIPRENAALPGESGERRRDTGADALRAATPPATSDRAAVEKAIREREAPAPEREALALNAAAAAPPGEGRALAAGAGGGSADGLAQARRQDAARHAVSGLARKRADDETAVETDRSALVATRAMPEQAAAAVDRESRLRAAAPGIPPHPGPASTGVVEGQSRDRFGQFAENRFRQAAEAPLSTFSIDVDTASYALVRRFLTGGRLPPRDAVRIEELVNYFRYATPRPEGDEPFAVSVEAAACPWRPGHRLVRIALAGRDVEREVRPAGNLVFLVDVSGSMGPPDRLPMVKQALAMLVEELGENDHVAIVTYAGDAGLRLPPINGTEKATILAAIESLTAGGSTHGSAGIALAYEQAAERFIPGGANRVILATDGDLNVGVTSDDELVELIRRQAAGGTFLTVLGVGTGNLQDEKLEKLAAHGNGVYAYLDSLREARKVLVEQLTGSTITIAKDVKIQVEFNPAVVASWRLIGYENRVMAARDFRDDAKDAGDIGAGHHVTAVYELALVGEADDQTGGEPLKYAPAEPAADVSSGGGSPAAAVAEVSRPADASAELLTVKLRYKQPEGSESVLREVPLADRGGEFAAASTDFRFAAAVAGFGMILRGSEFYGSATLPWVARTAAAALGDDPGGWRTEFLDLVRRAETLSGPVRPGMPEASRER